MDNAGTRLFSVTVDVSDVSLRFGGGVMTVEQQERLILSPGVVVVRRSPSSVQIGTDPRTSFVLEGLSPAEVAYLERVGTCRLWDAVAATPDLAAAARQLLGAGLLITQSDWRGTYSSPRPAGVVGVMGQGPLTELIVQTLESCRIEVVTPDPYVSDDPVDQTQQLAAWTVIMVNQHVADPVQARTLMSTQTPHLSVVEREASIGIGPFVYPGVSACLQCVDLHRVDVDSGWAMVASQLISGLMPKPQLPRHIRLAAASLAASQVLTHVEGRRPPTAWHPQDVHGSSVIDIVDPSGLPKIGYIPAHPACGCLGLHDLEHGGGTEGS